MAVSEGCISPLASRLAVRDVFVAFGCFVAAVACALAVHQLLQGPQVYDQFAVGTLAWRAESKKGELAAALAFIAAIPVTWAMLRRASRVYAGGYEPAATVALQAACIPAALCLAHAMLGEAKLEWLLVSVALLAWWVAGAVVAGFATRLLPRPHDSTIGFHPIPFMLVPVLGGFSAVGVVYALNRVLLIACPFPAFLAGFCCAGALLVIASMRGARRALDWNAAAVVAQLGIPLLAFALVPTPIERAGALEPAAALLPTAIASAVGAAVLWDVVRRATNARRGAFVAFISPWALLLCVFILKSPSTSILTLSTDDWHFGEALIPWISWRDFGLVPFADVMPVRGFISVVDLALAELLYGGTAADLAYVAPVTALLYAAIVFSSMRFAAGTLPALLGAAVLVDTSPLAQINCLFTAGVCLQAGFLVRGRHVAACLAWLVSSAVLLPIAPGQAVLYAIATGPLAAYAAWNMTRRELSWLSGATIAAGIALALTIVTVPVLERTLVGIWLYFADNVAVNTIGHGIPWSHSFRGHAKPTAAVLEAFRSFCVLAAALACLVGWRLYRQEREHRTDLTRPTVQVRLDRTHIILCLVIVLTVCLFLPRALGRIDPDFASRIGPVTWLVVGGIAPLVWARRLAPTMATLVALLTIVIANGPPDGPRLHTQALLIPQQSSNPAGTIDAATTGLKNTGSAKFDPRHLDHLRHLHTLLNDMLPPGTPYYDLTNRNAHYVYFGRPVPARWSSPYYLADERAQVRTAHELAARRVPLLLLAPALAMDEVTAALRAYWLYRFVLSDYVPFKRGGYIFAVRKDLADNARFGDLIRESAPAVDLYEEAFGMPDLQHIPRAWGLSSAELEKSLSPQSREARLTQAYERLTRLDARASEAQMSELPRFDMLVLEMACAGRGPVRLAWSTRDGGTTQTRTLDFVAASGTLFVPVGSRPGWTLAREITEVNLEHGATRCKVERAQWMHRTRPGITG